MMHKNIRKDLKKLRNVRKHQYHPLIYKIHKKYGISRKSIFYTKEYGAHSNIPKTIIRESIKILLLAAIISSLGGLALENIKIIFISIIPLIIILPALNDMIGDYGVIISSKFSTMLYTGKIRGKWYRDSNFQKLVVQIGIVAFLITLITASVALVISHFSGFLLTSDIILKIFFITLVDVLLIVFILFVIVVYAGYYFYKKKEDMNNFLIPIATSIADFGNMLLLAGLIILMF
ncbi:MAG: magnesium transporter [Candidatus Aenigmatarchaeota archaeon]